MIRHRNRFIAGFFGCLSSVLVATTQAQLSDAHVQSIKAADGTSFEIRAGIVHVPEIRSTANASSKSIDLAVVRVHRTGSTARKAHIVLAGGPGASGVTLVLGMAQQGGTSLADLMDGDLIGIDQRGTGKSSPNLASAVMYDLPLDRPGSPELWLPLIGRASRSVAAELRSRGIHLEAYNTLESADDVDDVRKALGYKTITLWGRSYGTHLALATLRRHPETIERLILVSPEGPNHTLKLPTQVDAIIERLGERASAPELPQQMRQVFDQLERTPAVVTTVHPVSRQPVTITIGAFDVRWATAQVLGDPRPTSTVPAAYRKMAAGDFQDIAQVILALRARFGVESAMKQVMDISSGATPDRLARIQREAATSLLGNAINFPGMDLRDAWGVKDLGDDFRKPVTSAVPTLILVGDLDPRTPVQNAREIAATLRNGRVVIVENASHQFDVFGSGPIRKLLHQFLTGLIVSEDRVVLPPLRFQK